MDDLLNELDPPALEPEERERRRRLVAAIGIAGLSLVTVTTLASGAWFTDTENLTGNELSTGSVELTVGGVSSMPFSVTNMAPGDVRTGTMSVTNSGSLALRYAVTADSLAVDVPGGGTGNLADQLDVAVYAGATCTGVPLYTGTIGDGPTVLFGDVAVGPDTGDRSLVASAAETLCVRASLDGPGTGNQWQLTGTNITFRFVAEQTLNNP